MTYDLTKKNVTFIWNDYCKIVFHRLRRKLSTNPVLAHPDFDQEFLLDTDANNERWCGALSNTEWGREMCCICK